MPFTANTIHSTSRGSGRFTRLQARQANVASIASTPVPAIATMRLLQLPVPGHST